MPRSAWKATHLKPCSTCCCNSRCNRLWAHCWKIAKSICQKTSKPIHWQPIFRSRSRMRKWTATSSSARHNSRLYKVWCKPCKHGSSPKASRKPSPKPSHNACPDSSRMPCTASGNATGHITTRYASTYRRHSYRRRNAKPPGPPMPRVCNGYSKKGYSANRSACARFTSP